MNLVAGPREQCMRTVGSLVTELAVRFGRGRFTIDAAASAENAHASHYFSAEWSALDRPWEKKHAANTPDISGWRPGPESVFVNPPYNNITPFVDHAIEQIKNPAIAVIVMLLPNREHLWRERCRMYGTIYPVRRRIWFKTPEGLFAKRPSESSIVVVFRKPLDAKDYRT